MDMHPLSSGGTSLTDGMSPPPGVPDVPRSYGGRKFAGNGAAPSVARLPDHIGQAPAGDNVEARAARKAAPLLRFRSQTGNVRNARLSDGARCPLAPWQLARAARFIAENLAEKISVRDVSVVSSLSPSHFSRAFRSTVGESPYAYIIRCRVERARHLIHATKMSLAEIALDCGFTDQAHLTKLFRRVVGICPGAWRRGQSAGRLSA